MMRLPCDIECNVETTHPSSRADAHAERQLEDAILKLQILHNELTAVDDAGNYRRNDNTALTWRMMLDVGSVISEVMKDVKDYSVAVAQLTSTMFYHPRQQPNQSAPSSNPVFTI